MPVILTNRVATIEINFNVNLQQIVDKGSFDVTVLDGNDGVSDVKYVWIIMRNPTQISQDIQLDWRDISDPSDLTSAEDLRDRLLAWNIPPSIITDGSNNVVITEDSALQSTTMVQDEYGNITRILGDNIFKGALITIPVEHHEIHCGDAYEFSYIADLGNNGVLDILIIVPDEGLTETEPGLQQDVKQYHFRGKVATEFESSVMFYEGATVTDNGTAISVYNRNRNASAYVDFLDVYHTPTVTATGTLLESNKIGSARSVGGPAGREEEWILKNNTIYLLRIINDTSNNNYVDVHANYYVHPGI